MTQFLDLNWQQQSATRNLEVKSQAAWQGYCKYRLASPKNDISRKMGCNQEKRDLLETKLGINHIEILLIVVAFWGLH